MYQTVRYRTEEKLADCRPPAAPDDHDVRAGLPGHVGDNHRRFALTTFDPIGHGALAALAFDTAAYLLLDDVEDVAEFSFRYVGRREESGQVSSMHRDDLGGGKILGQRAKTRPNASHSRRESGRPHPSRCSLSTPTMCGRRGSARAR